MMLIVLYGEISDSHNGKQQRMIDGGCTCGYREYARNYGHIIYMTSQNVKLDWEHSITNPKKVVEFIKKYPDAIVWSVKHSPRKNSEILKRINNKKVYYSCNARNMYNNYCDVSLVDTPERVRGNGKLWFKGKDPNYWLPNSNKEYDFLLLGRRGDKNEVWFLNQLNKVKDPRKILWIGGDKHKHNVRSKHKVIYTKFIGQNDVRNLIPTAKVGVLFTELTVEGFPQSFLEMTMSGLPVIYNINAPINKYYICKYNCLLCSKQNLIISAEKLLRTYDPVKCREEAIENYSLEKSYEGIIKCLK